MQFTLALSGVQLMTSLKKEEDDFQWLGGMATSVLNWAPDQPAKLAGNCACILENLFSAMHCEQPKNFMCESPDPQGLESIIIQILIVRNKIATYRVPENFQSLPIDKGANNCYDFSLFFYFFILFSSKDYNWRSKICNSC